MPRRLGVLAKSEQTRERIVRAASAAFRQHGIDGVGVRDIMKRAGLTQGGFYFHFRDKGALFKEAARHAVPTPSLFAPLARAEPGQELPAFIENYLSREHRDHAESGCMMAALGADVARSGRKQREGFGEAVGMILDRLAPYVDGADPAERRRKAGLLMSSMAGVLMVSRVLADGDKSDALLAAARKFYVATFCKS